MSDDPIHGPVKLEVNASGFGTLTVGDADISNAVGEVTIIARVGQQSLVTCKDPAVRVEVGMPVLALLARGHQVTLLDAERAALIALGWTPPAVTP